MTRLPVLQRFSPTAVDAHPLVKVVNRSNLNEPRARREIAWIARRGSQLLVGGITLVAMLLGPTWPASAAGTPMYRATLYEAPLAHQPAPGRYLPLAGYQARAETPPDPRSQQLAPSEPADVAELLAALGMRTSRSEDPKQTYTSGDSPDPSTSQHGDTGPTGAGHRPVDAGGAVSEKTKFSNLVMTKI
jgi:hypothetical protein